MPLVAGGLRRHGSSRVRARSQVHRELQSASPPPAGLPPAQSRAAGRAPLFLVSGSWLHLLHNTFPFFFFFSVANQRESETIDTAG